jgi:hypothetical protein
VACVITGEGFVRTTKGEVYANQIEDKHLPDVEVTVTGLNTVFASGTNLRLTLSASSSPSELE